MKLSPHKLRRTPPLITLLTDFGTADPYVAAMKLAILRRCPTAQLIDITHAIPPQDILAASIALERAVAAAPPGTIHLAVVDPGVGTARRILVAQFAQQLIICPDNGLITWTLRRHAQPSPSPGTPACGEPSRTGEGGGEGLPSATKRARPSRNSSRGVTLRALKTILPSASQTFHGRDIMAPLAADLANGRSFPTRPVNNPILLNIDLARPAKIIQGQIIQIDHFGNATTNIPSNLIKKSAIIRAVARPIPLHKTYSEVPPNKPLALVNSSDLLEIAVRNNSAARLLRLRIGDKITLSPRK